MSSLKLAVSPIQVARRLVAVAAAVVLAATLAPREARADVMLAADAADGGVAAYGDVIAWSRWDRTAGGFRLVVRRGGHTAPLPVAPSPRQLDASAGPGPDGSVWLVWARCNDVVSSGCDVVRYDLDDPGERPIAAAARPGIDETAPSIWRRLIAFVRRTPTGTAMDTSIMIAPVAGGRARSIAVVPATTCGVGISDGCEARALRSVHSLALRGSKVLVASAVEAGIGICGFSTVRWVDLRTRDARQIAAAVCGLGGAGFGSTTFDDRGNAWYVKLCPGDSDPRIGARTGPFRYTPSSGRTTHLATPYGSRVRAVGLARKTAVVMAALRRRPLAAPPCELITDYLSPSEQCQLVTTISPQRFTPAATRSGGDEPSPGYRSVRRTKSLGLLQPPRELPCVLANPAPRRRPVLWAGAREILDARVQMARGELDRALERCTGVEAAGDVSVGDPAGALAALSGDCDLLVLGSRRWGTVRRLALGSTSEHVIRHAQCPILVPPRGVATGRDAATRAAHENVLI